MLERTAGCLESGNLRRLLPTSRKSLKSRRTLHSGFWAYGAGSCEVSPLWAVLVRAADQLQQETEDRKLNKHESSGSGSFLDFLYPKATLSFLGQCSGFLSDRQDGRHKKSGINRLGQRQYSSTASEIQPTSYALESTLREESALLMKFDGLPPTGVKRVAATSTNAAISEASIGAPVKEQQIIEKSNHATNSVKPDRAGRKTKFPRDANNSEYDNTALIFEKLAISKTVDWEEAWRNFESLKETERPVLKKPLLGYLRTSERRLDAIRSLDLFDTISKSKRDHFAYRYAIRAHLKLKDLSAAMALYETAKEHKKAAVGSEELLLYFVRARDFVSAFDLWSTASPHKELVPKCHAPIYDMFDTISDLPDFARQLARYAISTVKVNQANPSNSEKILWKTFVSEVIILASTKEKKFDALNYKAFSAILRSWGTDVQDFYARSIDLFLEIRRPAMAVRSYRYARSRARTLHFSRELLHKILKLMCERYYVTGMQQVLDDFFRIYRRPTREAYQMCLTAFAAHGDAETVHSLFNQYALRNTREVPGGARYDLDAMDCEPIIHVHAKRGEVDLALKHFNDMKTKYGIIPRVRNWNILINAYVKVNDVEGAYMCFEDVIKAGVRPDDYTIGTLMSLATHRGDLDRVLELFDLSKDLDIPPTEIFVNCLVQSYINENDLYQAEKICENSTKLEFRGSRVRMWNLLVIAYATKGDLININRVLRRMTEAKIEYDEHTYSALMHALSFLRRPNQAYKILRDVLPSVGIRPRASHFVTVMGGYIKNKEPHKALRLHRIMNKAFVPNTASVEFMSLKATSRCDVKVSEGKKAQHRRHARILDMYQQLLASIDRQEITQVPRIGFGHLPLDIAYTTMLHSHTISVLSSEKATVERLFQTFLSTIPPSRRAEFPPLEILSALMQAKLKEDDHSKHKAIEEYWNMARSVAKDNGCAIPFSIKNDDIGEPVVSKIGESAATERQLIMTPHQLSLNRHLALYMKSLHEQQKYDQIIAIVEKQIRDGYALDNPNWNAYIRFLCSGNRLKLAFQLCEQHLINNFTGFRKERRRAKRSGADFELTKEARLERRESRYLRPYYSTLLYLTRAWMDLNADAVDSKKAVHILAELKLKTPKVARVVANMPMSGEELQMAILSRVDLAGK